MRQLGLKICLTTIATLVCLIILELGLRSYEWIFFNTPLAYSVANYEDKVLGWQGKKIFGEPQTTKFKIFILGDSFTEAGLLKEEEIYYNVFKQHSDNVELFVYAGAGYGTLQEYLALDRYIDEIDPDLIILQVTGNDVINNSLSLEVKSFANNNLYLRPYLINDEVKLEFPSKLGLNRFILTKYSRLGYRSLAAIDQISAALAQKGWLHSVEEAQMRVKYAKDYILAKKITQELLAKIKLRSGQTPVVLFPATISQPELNNLIKGELENKYWLEQPAKKIKELTLQGNNLHEPDGEHWNAQGHQLVGEVLWQELVANGFVSN